MTYKDIFDLFGVEYMVCDEGTIHEWGDGSIDLDKYLAIVSFLKSFNFKKTEGLDDIDDLYGEHGYWQGLCSRQVLNHTVTVSYNTSLLPHIASRGELVVEPEHDE